MTTHTAHAPMHLTPSTAGLGVAGLLVAAAAGFALVSAADDPAPVAPSPVVSQVDPPSGARDSWEGRIGPDADRGGVGGTGQQLDRFGGR